MSCGYIVCNVSNTIAQSFLEQTREVRSALTFFSARDSAVLKAKYRECQNPLGDTLCIFTIYALHVLPLQRYVPFLVKRLTGTKGLKRIVKFR